MSDSYQSPWYYTLQGGEEEEPVETIRPQPRSPKSRVRKNCKTIIPAARIPEALFRKGLEKFGVKVNDPFADREILRDAVIPQISDLLLDYGKPEWSLRPRTFVILWLLGIPEKLDAFISEDRTDHYLPYSEGNLPDAIHGSQLRHKFLKLQSIVRCRQEDLADLEDGGRHLSLLGDADAYFFSMKTLGQGRFAKVDKVRSRQTTELYARKQILRGESVLEDRGQLAAFEKELKSLKALRHHHVVKLVGSYTDPTSLGIIMKPIADMNLQEYLDSTSIEPEHRKRMLRSFFGCLTTALAYIHKNNVRHKDIKPANILVTDNRVLLSDFGTSRICLDGHLTTNGELLEGTPRYWAPEVGDGAERNTASDVWSLGCVFLEMATILFGYSHKDMLGFYSRVGTENVRRISLNPRGTELWIEKLRSDWHMADLVVLKWTSSMLQPNPHDRPTAGQLRGKIIDDRSDFDYICHDCSSKSGVTRRHDSFGSSCRGSTTAAGVYPTDSTSSHLSSSQRMMPSTPTPKKPRDTSSPEIKNKISKYTPVKQQTTQSDPIIKTTPSLPSVESNKQQTNVEKTEEISDTIGTEEEIQPKPIQPEVKRVRFRDDEKMAPIISYNFIPQETPPRRPQATGRFTRLPEDSRPKVYTVEEPGDEAEEFEDDFEDFIIPESLGPPPFGDKPGTPTPLPKATLAPSYILAGSNRMSQEEIRCSLDEDGCTNTFNIFVYGRLLFPAILHAIAAGSSRGAYAADLQRRIFPVPADWNEAGRSIQRASEIMTPARLRGHDRWKCPGSQAAAIVRSSSTQRILERRGQHGYGDLRPQGEIVGHLIVGLRMEALKYLDLLLASTKGNLESLQPQRREEGSVGVEIESGHRKSPFQRTEVTVDVELVSGEMTTAKAYTYSLKHRTRHVVHLWREDDFIRTDCVQKLFGSKRDWIEEERELAKTMRIGYALPGDQLCGAVLTRNLDKLEDLLVGGSGINEPCKVYGSVLQAAVVTGDEDMVTLLIDHGANVNAQGGRYGTPLIAAAFASRKSITRLLLSSGADVFDTNPMYVNALYQAVGHSDYAITEMLLEHASWLVEDWGEVCDMATEVGDREIQSLLRQYDVRQMHRRQLESSRTEQLEDETSKTDVFKAVIKRFATVQAMTGNWKGRKGVAVTLAALNAGASLSILHYIRQAVNPVQLLLRELQKRDNGGVFPDSGFQIDGNGTISVA